MAGVAAVMWAGLAPQCFESETFISRHLKLSNSLNLISNQILSRWIRYSDSDLVKIHLKNPLSHLSTPRLYLDFYLWVTSFLTW